MNKSYLIALVIYALHGQVAAQAVQGQHIGRPVYGAIDATSLAQIRFASRSVLAAKASETADPDAVQMEKDLLELRGGIKDALEKSLQPSEKIRDGKGASDDASKLEDLKIKLSQFGERKRVIRRRGSGSALKEQLREQQLNAADSIENEIGEAVVTTTGMGRMEKLKALYEKLQPRSQAELIYQQRAAMARQHPEQAAFWLSESVSPTIKFSVINEK